ncbi:MAG: hypothetical protein H6712_14860 [Myxococcales bacterium]|nr:hypothetical protein [Myxococcales bacterium]MCB9715145.1 hypothetical protein [Myxococcales bacterium]
MSELSEQELQEAAREAGISPMELRHALAERQGSDLARPDEARSLMGPPSRGTTAGFVEGRLAQPPGEAIDVVRASIERQSGRTGHRQGAAEADVVDDVLGINYRLRAQDDGTGGALVRVDVDPTSGRSFRNLAATGVAGITVVMMGIGWLLGSTLLGLGGVAVGVLGALALVRRTARLAQGIASARAIASQALMEAEDRAAPQALPPSRG